jgi:hypothetical protein
VMTQRAQPRYDDWVVWIALLPALLTLSALGITAAMAWQNQAVWHAVTVSAIPDDGDGYVRGLAKLGITNLPGLQHPGESMKPVVADK